MNLGAPQLLCPWKRDGVLYSKAMPTKLHSIIQRVLATLLAAALPKGTQSFPELTLRVSPSRYLKPGVAVADDFPGPYPTEAVRLCCEILSRDDRLGATFAKCTSKWKRTSPPSKPASTNLRAARPSTGQARPSEPKRPTIPRPHTSAARPQSPEESPLACGVPPHATQARQLPAPPQTPSPARCA